MRADGVRDASDALARMSQVGHSYVLTTSGRGEISIPRRDMRVVIPFVVRKTALPAVALWAPFACRQGRANDTIREPGRTSGKTRIAPSALPPNLLDSRESGTPETQRSDVAPSA